MLSNAILGKITAAFFSKGAITDVCTIESLRKISTLTGDLVPVIFLIFT